MEENFRESYFFIDLCYKRAICGYVGANREGGTPVSIPNTEVKPFIADGTARFALWESRTVPTLLLFFVFFFLRVLSSATLEKRVYLLLLALQRRYFSLFIKRRFFTKNLCLIHI